MITDFRVYLDVKSWKLNSMIKVPLTQGLPSEVDPFDFLCPPFNGVTLIARVIRSAILTGNPW
jgi:hypothetical protein